MTDWAPANELEERMRTAVAANDVPAYLRLLADAELVLPVDPAKAVRESQRGWATFESDGNTVLATYTSGASMAVATKGAFASFRKERFAELIGHWPDERWRLAINVNTPIGAEFGLPALRSMLADNAPGTAAAAARPTPEPAVEPLRTAGGGVMQKVIPPGQLALYLDEGYDLVAGYVYKLADVRMLRTARDLVTGLALDYPDSPFSVSDEYVHVIRWTAVATAMYRVPFGGRNEADLRVWGSDGWVVDHPPFTGNGFVANPDTQIPEWKVASVRVTDGAELWRVDQHGREALVAVYLAGTKRWHRNANLEDR